ncbi:MAG: CU044_5270 family protein [Micropruina sp.]|nr:CU044_5270 family protein [Micropruina sp.]
MNTLDSRLRASDPAHDLPSYSPAEADTLLAKVTSTRSHQSRRTAILVAASLAVGALVSQTLLPFGGGATAAAADLLDRASLITADPPSRPDQYWKVTTTSTTSDILGEGEWGDPLTVSVLREAERVTFMAVDGTRPSWFSDRTGPYTRQISGPPTALPEVGWSTAKRWTSNLSPRQSAAAALDLPSDPTLLRAELYRAAHGRGVSLDGEVVVLVADALRDLPIPAALRQAMFQVLKTIPGVDVLESGLTFGGRHAVALGRLEAVSSIRQELIFDADTGEFLGERGVYSNLPGHPAQESSIRRELVDAVDPDVVATARHQQCEADAAGKVECRVK